MEDSDGERTHLSLAAYNMTFRHSSRLSCRFFFSPFPCYFPRGFQNINFNFLCIAWCFVRTLNRSGMSREKKTYFVRMRTPVDSGMARKDNLPLVVETRPLPSPPTQKSEHPRRSWHPVLWWFGRHTCLLNHFIYQQLVVCLWFQVSLPKTSGTDSKHGKH